MNLRTGAFAALSVGLVLLFRVAPRPEFTRPAFADAKNASDSSRPANTGPTPVLVELFTSEGCSSCPPADALLSRLGKTQPVREAEIIALEEHVDYWDQLGWKDPFSSEAATARQGEYGKAFGGREIYTPQMVVDGRAEFVGSSDDDALSTIRAASETPKPAVRLSWQPGNRLEIHVDRLINASRDDSFQLFLIIAEDMLRSNVKRGENAGRALEHNGVVRQLLPLGRVEETPSGFSSAATVHSAGEWNRAKLRAVVFVQERRSRHILAVSAIPFPS
jgi:hypothetical protein